MAVVLDTGAVSRGSGAKGSNRERDIRKAFVEADLVEGVVLLPENLFYNTSAAGVIVILNKRKPASHRGTMVMLNASRRFRKGRPKNYLPDEEVRQLASLYHARQPVEGELAVITVDQASEADYNLSPGRWAVQSAAVSDRPIGEIVAEIVDLDERAREVDVALAKMLATL